MLSNTGSIGNIWDVDHIGFNTAEGGTHLQTTFNQLGSAPATILLVALYANYLIQDLLYSLGKIPVEQKYR